MAYYNFVLFATTKKDFNKIMDKQNKIPDNYLFNEAEIEEYKEDGIDCVYVDLGRVRYSKEYEEVQALEKSFSELQDGYVFCRLGEDPADIEFRKRTKLPELMKEFEFIKDIRDSLSKELNDEEEEEFE